MLNNTLNDAIKFGFVKDMSTKSTRENNVSKKDDKIDMTRLFSNKFKESKKIRLSNFKGAAIVLTTLVTYFLFFVR